MRRMSGRNPNFALAGLILVIFLLVYKCWTLSSQNDDLRKEIYKLQTELKISGVKQEQFEKKNQMLQGNIHALDETKDKLTAQVDEETQQLQDYIKNIKTKEYEITSLKNSLLKKEEMEKDLTQQLDDKENKIEELVSDSQHILTLKNDAEEALSEKDSQINNLKRELEQAKSVATEYEARLTNVKEEFSKLRKEVEIKQKEEARPPMVPGPFNIPNLENKGPYLAHGGLGYTPKRTVHTLNRGQKGLQYHPGAEILPRQPSSTKRAKPKFSILDLVNKSLSRDPAKSQIQEPDAKPPADDHLSKGVLLGDAAGDPHRNVIPNPPLSGQDNQHQQNTHETNNGVIDKPNNKPLIDDLGVAAAQEQAVANPVLQGPVLHDSNLNFHHEGHNPVLQEPHHAQPKEQAQMVLAPPRNLEGNLDTAVDEDPKEAVDDPLDDQDEEGKEIKRDLENNAADNYDNYDDDKVDNPHLIKDDTAGGPDDARHEPKGIGAGEIGRRGGSNDRDNENENDKEQAGHDDVNLVDDVDQRANERVYEANFDNKIRNLGKL